MDALCIIVAAIAGLIGGLLGSWIRSLPQSQPDFTVPVRLADGWWLPKAECPPPPAPPAPPPPPNMINQKRRPFVMVNGRTIAEDMERACTLVPLYAAPPTWQEEVAAVEAAFERSGVKPTWPDDEPGNIGPMAAAMAVEIRRLTLAVEELDAIEHGLEQIELHSDLESRSSAKAIRGLLDRIEGGER